MAATIKFSDASNTLESLRVLTELGKRLPQLSTNKQYQRSIPLFMLAIDFKSFMVSTGNIEEASSFGLLRLYEAPRLQKVVLCAEAVWFADNTLQTQLATWAMIASFGKRVGVVALCIHENSVAFPRTLDDLVRAGDIDGRPFERKTAFLLKPLGKDDLTHGLYSSFCQNVSSAAFPTSCVRVLI